MYSASHTTLPLVHGANISEREKHSLGYIMEEYFHQVFSAMHIDTVVIRYIAVKYNFVLFCNIIFCMLNCHTVTEPKRLLFSYNDSVP